jgi:hypothetical protein
MARRKYRSGFERDIAEKLKGWQYEGMKVPYVVHRNYIPDFVFNSYLIECKGYFRVGDTKKYTSIRDSVDDYELVFILYNPDTKIRKGAKMSMSQWCEKEGFKWYTIDSIKEMKKDLK